MPRPDHVPQLVLSQTFGIIFNRYELLVFIEDDRDRNILGFSATHPPVEPGGIANALAVFATCRSFDGTDHGITADG